ncbi:MAG: hypothetical protein NC191_03965 [Muribaculaceae bacterium]|nr:hypothetical protein [Muribaculaceae bacterium]
MVENLQFNLLNNPYLGVDKSNMSNKIGSSQVSAPKFSAATRMSFQAKTDSFGFSQDSKNAQVKLELAARVSDVSTNLKDVEDHNGFIGKAWSWTKNTFGFGASSNKVEKAQSAEQKLLEQFEDNPQAVFEELTGAPYSDENLDKFLNGEIKLKSEQALDCYREGQAECSDIVGDIVSGFAAFGAYSLALAAAPFTGGASIAVGIAAAATVGGVVKAGVKAADAKSGGREYDSFTRDMVTGAFSGLLAPITGGAGGAVGKTIASRLGLEALSIGGKSVAKGAGEQVVKQGLKSILTNPAGYTYAGGSVLKRGLAYGTEMMVDGALSGAIDNGFRTAYDGGSLSDVVDSAKQGFVGGAILAPVIGGGLKVTGHAVSHIKDKPHFTGSEPLIKTDIDLESRAELDALDAILAKARAKKVVDKPDASSKTSASASTSASSVSHPPKVEISTPNNVRECYNEHVNHVGIDLNSGQIAGGHNSAFYPDYFVNVAQPHSYTLRGNALRTINDALRELDTEFSRASGNCRVTRSGDKFVIEFEFTSRDGGSIYRELNPDGSFTLPKYATNPNDVVTVPASDKLRKRYDSTVQSHIDNLAAELGFDVNPQTFKDVTINVDEGGTIEIVTTYKQNGRVKKYKFEPLETDEPGLKIYKQSCDDVEFATPKTSCDGRLLSDIADFLEKGTDKFEATHIPESNLYLFNYENITFQAVIDDFGNMTTFYPVTKDYLWNTHNLIKDDVVDLTNTIKVCNT